MTDETGGRSLAAPGRDPVSFGTREPLEEMLSEPSLGGWCQALILQSEKRGRSRCGKQLVQRSGDTKEHGVQCGSVGCVSFIRECVWVSCVGEAELQEVNRTISPALGFGTEPVNCGLEGKAVLPESEGWESF